MRPSILCRYYPRILAPTHTPFLSLDSKSQVLSEKTNHTHIWKKTTPLIRAYEKWHKNVLPKKGTQISTPNMMTIKCSRSNKFQFKISGQNINLEIISSDHRHHRWRFCHFVFVFVGVIFTSQIVNLILISQQFAQCTTMKHYATEWHLFEHQHIAFFPRLHYFQYELIAFHRFSWLCHELYMHFSVFSLQFLFFIEFIIYSNAF